MKKIKCLNPWDPQSKRQYMIDGLYPALNAGHGGADRLTEFVMKVHPKITGALCANSHPGSYTGQDAFNDMLPVYRRKDEMVLLRKRAVSDNRSVSGIEHPGLYARPEIYSGGGLSWKRITAENMSFAA